MKRLAALILMLGLVVNLVGCAPVEQHARDAAAALAGVLVYAQGRYEPGCKANPSQQVCALINKGVSAQNGLITAVETYCGWSTSAPPDLMAPCTPVKSAIPALKAATANAVQITKEIKGAI